jgi:hypothetical protein
MMRLQSQAEGVEPFGHVYKRSNGLLAGSGRGVAGKR